MIAAAHGQKSAAPSAKGASTVDKEAFDRVCGACHPSAMVDGYRSELDWRETVDNMIATGAKGSAEDFARVMRYLARTWTRIDLNTASAAQIAAVLGVKETAAIAIVKYRTERGPFGSIAELKKVPGFEQIKPEEYKDKLVVSGEGKDKE
jgi:competence ComEA-like helix-hairpin-helix protein